MVHTGAAFGEDDFRLAQENGLTIHNPVRPDGTFDERAGPFAGHVRARRRRRRSSRRCASPAASSAPASTSTPTRTAGAAARRSSTTRRRTGTCAPPRSRTQLLAANEAVTWYPDHIKHGRFGKWLENNVDWALSRERYWGTPLPIWRCEEGHVVCVGSRAEIEERGGEVPDDLHRPYIDEIDLRCDCGEDMRRVPDLIDVWWDSGCMPFAQWHAPFENEDTLRASASRPTTSARRSTRRAAGSTRCSPSRRCSSAELLQDRALPRPDPRRRGPEDVEVEGQRRGALGRDRRARRGRLALVLLHLEAALGRLPLLARGRGGVGAPVPEDALEHVLVLRPLRERERRARARASPPTSTAGSARAWPPPSERVTERMEDYDTTFAGRAIAEFVDDLSNWYVRRSRRRFWDGDPAAFATLRECLLTVVEAAGPAHAVRERRDLREPRRLRALGAPVRLPGAGRARPRARVADAGGARRGGARAARRARTPR